VLIDWEVTRRRSQLVNRVDVDYSSGTETASDATSISNFGILTKQISTFLDSSADAQAYADFELSRATVPAFYLDRITVAAHTLTPADYDVLIVAAIRRPSTLLDSTGGAFLLNIPELFEGMFLNFFVEGATYTITRNTADVELSISEASLTRPPQRWVDVPGSIIWQNVIPTQIWTDLDKEQVRTA